MTNQLFCIKYKIQFSNETKSKTKPRHTDADDVHIRL
jgi:hypothetical protein